MVTPPYHSSDSPVLLGFEGRAATEYRPYDPDVLDRIRIDLVRILLEDDEVGQLAGN